jgi:type I restriction enzyme S subunit
MQDLLTKGIDENGNIRDEKTHKFKDSPLGRIPEEWEVVRLGEVSYLKGRIGWHGLTVQEYLDEGEYYLVTGINFIDGRINWDSCVYVSKARYEMDRYIQLKKDDILVTKDGTIGKVAYIFQVPKPATLGTGVFVLRPICKSYYPNFLYYVLKSFIFDRFMENLKAGSTINHLYQKDFVNFFLPLPPLPEQQRIAEILSQIDQTIEKEQQYKEKLKRIKQGLMEDLLTGKVRVNTLIKE